MSKVNVIIKDSRPIVRDVDEPELITMYEAACSLKDEFESKYGDNILGFVFDRPEDFLVINV